MTNRKYVYGLIYLRKRGRFGSTGGADDDDKIRLKLGIGETRLKRLSKLSRLMKRALNDVNLNIYPHADVTGSLEKS